MKNFARSFTAGLLFCFLFSAALFAGRKQEMVSQYAGMEKVKIKLILGSCHIEKSKDNSIHVKVVHSYDEDDFEAKINTKGKTLYLKEKLHSDNNGGHSDWTVAVPNGMEVDFETATGSLDITGVEDLEIDGNSGTGSHEIEEASGKFKLNTGTGSIEAINSKGDFDLNTGTGRVKIENCKGNFDANSGTGNVFGRSITIEDEAEFSSGTGDAEAAKPMGKDFDLSLSSGTGDAVLDMDGQPIEGYFEFTANARRGRIISPIKFDKEEEDEDGNNNYYRKSFTKGKKTPRYFISTGTGKAELER